MKKVLLLVATLFALTSCDNTHSMADDAIKAELKSSESYKAIEYSDLKPFGKDKSNPEGYYMNVKYSATNGFGARLDDTKQVYFTLDKKQCSLKAGLIDPEMKKMEDAIDSLKSEGAGY